MNKPYKPIPPFKGMVLQNFPFIEEDFDAITNYQLLCKVVEYLKLVIDNEQIVEENITSLYNSFVELKNYIDNYFDNLDVQEEINNKLDEMVISGQLQEIIADYLNSKAVFGFDNVNYMKNATNLINGSYAETLGFYNKNDGGSSLYKIRTITNDDVVDEQFIIALNDNTLIAELIIKDGTINTKQIGCYGDGVHDDTNKIQSAINYIKNNIISNNTYEGNTTLLFIGGKYKITDTINTYPFITIKSSSMTTIISDINKTMIKINASNDIPEDYYVSYTLRDVIDGTNGFKILNTNDEATESIGIELVNTLSSNRKTAKITLNSVAILGNKIGIKVNNQNMYLLRFVNVNVANNNVGFQFGDSVNYSQVNSGENIVFERCLFVNDSAIKFYISGIDCNFINCSFDFCGNLFEQAKTGGYRKLYINGGHIEGISEKIISSNMVSSELFISGVRFFIDPNNNYFPTNMTTNVFINNCSIGFSETPNQSPTSFLFPLNNVFLQNNIIGIDSVGKPINFNKNLVLHNTFDNAEDGEIVYSAGGDIGSYTFDGKTNVSTIEIVNTNIFGSDNVGKLVKVTKDDITANSNLALLSDFIPCNIGEKYRLYVAGKNCFKATSCVVKCYDINKVRLQNLTVNYNNSNESNNKDEFLFTKHYATFVIPKNTSYIKVEYIFANENTSVSDYYCGGIFVEKI